MGTGGLANGQIGIGTMNPTARLEVAGQIKITGGTPGVNKVLVSDATGLASWQSSPASCVATGTGTGNQCYGVNSLQNNTSGYENSAFGDRALRDNTTGNGNTAIGHDAMYSTSTSARNVAIGQFSMGSGNGDDNVAIGYATMWLGAVGAGNIALGSMSMGNGVAGTDNVAIGKNSMFWIGALGALAPGDNNVSV